MGAGEIVGLAFVICIVAAVVIARRRGRQAWQAAIAEARAEGHAEAAAAAVATGNRVDLHLGDGHHYRSESHEQTVERVIGELRDRGRYGDTESDGLPASVVRAELLRMDALQRRRILDEIRVGELLDGLHRGPDEGQPHGRALAAGGLVHRDVSADGRTAPVAD